MRLMKWAQRKRHFVYALTVIASGAILLTSSLVTQHTSAQGTNSIYISPPSGNYSVGSSFVATIRVNTTDTINAVAADLTYSANLQYVSIDGSGSAFGIDASSSGGSGSVSISRANISAVSGDQLVAKVTFRAVSAGTGTIGMAGSSQALSSTTNQNVIAARNGGSYSLQATATPTPTPTPTPASPTPTPTPTPAAKTTTTNLPQTSIATQGNATTTPLPGDSTVELSAPATVETTTDGTKQITKIEYILNGKVVTTDTTPPYSHNIDTTKYRNGTYSLISKTYYADGKVDSSKVSLVVKNPFGFKQLMLQVKHYAWLIIILLIVAGELFYLKFVRGKGYNIPKPKGPSTPNITGHGDAIVGGSSGVITPNTGTTIVTPTPAPESTPAPIPTPTPTAAPTTKP
jgi:hypothetical protein